MWNKQIYCWQLQNHVWIQNFRSSNRKITMLWKICVSLRGPMTWKGMPRNVRSDIVSWPTRRLNNSTEYQLHALMTIISKNKKWNPWENCQKYALKLFWNAANWHVLEDVIFHGHWTNLHDRSQNGPKPVTNAWIDWYLKFITNVNINSIVMQAGTVSRLRFCGRSWGFKIYIRWNIVYFGKSYICSNKLDV